MNRTFSVLTVLIVLGLCGNLGAQQAAQPKGSWLSTSYLKLFLPQDWGCELKQTQYVCIDKKYANKNYAVIVVSAKRASPEDSLEAYMTYLRKPITKVTPKFQEIISKVVAVTPVTINGTNWIDATHLESEVPSYFTRYLTTRKDDLSALISFSYHKDYRIAFERLFNEIAASVTLTGSSQITEEQTDVALLAGQNFQGIGEDMTADSLPEIVRRKSSIVLFAGFALVCLFFLFIVLRKRKK